MKLTIIYVGKENVQSENKDYLVVMANIVDDNGKTLTQKRLAFEPSITEEELKAEMAKVLETYKSDLEVGIKSEQIEKDNANVNELSKTLTGFEIE